MWSDLTQSHTPISPLLLPCNSLFPTGGKKCSWGPLGSKNYFILGVQWSEALAWDLAGVSRECGAGEEVTCAQNEHFKVKAGCVVWVGTADSVKKYMNLDSVIQRK